MNDLVLFEASTPATGAELWRTDGTAEGTQLVKDIRPGPSYSALNSFTVANGMLFFTADDGTHGHELWKSDGTEAGTRLIKDIDPGPNNGLYPGYMIEFDGLVYFRTDEPATGQELWRTDGTEAGTVLVKDINPGSASSHISPMIAMNGQLLFWAVTGATTSWGGGSNGWALWRSDGTEAGTTMVKDIAPGAIPSVLQAFYEVDGVAYFSGADTIHGGELWRTDGTEQGTWMVKDIQPDSASSWISEMRVLGNGVIFSAATEAEGRELWFSDGTEQGTYLVLDLYPGPENGIIGIHNPVVVDGWLFFAGRDDTMTSPFGLYITNGMDTYLVTDDLSGLGSLFPACGGVVFDGHDGVHGWELWYSNGTYAGTYMINDINSGAAASHPSHFHQHGEHLIFHANTNEFGIEPWIFACTAVGIRENRDILPLAINPNPADHLTRITLPDSGGSWDIQVTDMEGKLIHRSRPATASVVLDLAEWRTGLYCVSARSQGVQAHTKLVVMRP